MASGSPRLQSLDVMRGLVILAMLFVNDAAGVKGLPPWLGHMPAQADAMTFVDLVFPAFLFMVGMALPFAIGRRLEAGEAPGHVWRHVGLRSASLVALGFLMVNGDAMREDGVLSPDAWQLLLYTGILLVWNGYGNWRREHPRWVLAGRLAGVCVLILAGILYSGPAGHGLLALRPQWWGILGLIGWAYLAACLVYIPARRRPEALLGFMALFLVFQIAGQVSLFARFPFLGGSSPLNSTAPHGAIVLAGALLGSIVQTDSEGVRMRWTLIFAATLYGASLLLHILAPLHEVFIISKILATPPWCLRCAAYSALLWLGLHLVVDVKGWHRGTSFLAQAGGNALFAYILAPAAVSLVEVVTRILHVPGWDSLGGHLTTGLARAAIAALGLTWLAGYLGRKGLSLKL